MLSKQEVEDCGYTVLPRGGWVYVDPEIMPHDWDDLAKSFNFDPDCRGVYLCVCGVKEIDDGEIKFYSCITKQIDS